MRGVGQPGPMALHERSMISHLAVGCLVILGACGPAAGGADTGDGTSGGAQDAGLDDDPGGPLPADDGPAPGDDGTTGVGPASGSGSGPSGQTGVGDTGATDTGGGDTGGSDTGVGDTGVGDTGVADTGAGDTGAGGPTSSTGGDEAGDVGESGAAVLEISGVVVAGVNPGGDGIGTLYVGLTASIDCFDGSTSFTDVIYAADLSEIGNAVPFSLSVQTDDPEYDHVLQVFLDDDDDAVFETPDEGDMVLVPTGFEEVAGCVPLGPLTGNIDNLVIELDHIVP